MIYLQQYILRGIKLGLIMSVFFASTMSFSQNEKLVTYDPNKIYTQRFVDSLLDALKLAKKKKIEPLELKKILKSDSTLYGWTYYYLGKCVVSFREKKYDSTKYYARLGLDRYNAYEKSRGKHQEDVMLLYYYLGDANVELMNYGEAVLNYQYALDLTLEVPSVYKPFFISGIAISHYHIGNDSLALKYYREVISDSVYMSFPQASVSTLARIGILEKNFDRHEIAEKMFLRAVKISDSTNYKADLDAIYGGLGEIALKEKRFGSALSYFKKSVWSNEKNGVNDQINARNYNAFYKAYVKLKEGPLKQGVVEMEHLVDTLQSLKTKSRIDKILFTMCSQSLVEAYTNLGKKEEYNVLINKVFDFLDSYYQGQLQENIQNIDIKYQTKQKDAFITLLENEARNKELILTQRRTINRIIMISLLLILTSVFLLFRQKQQKEMYKTLNLEQRLLSSQLNPHFIFNALNTVSGLVQKKSENTVIYISKLGGLIRSILNNSREEFISLEEELATLTDYIELQSNFSSKFKFVLNIDSSILDLSHIIIPPMFVQPFVENSIQHGFIGASNEQITISVKLVEKQKLVEFIIEDNGLGYSKTRRKQKTKNHESLSGKILKERLQLYGKLFKVKARYTITNKEMGVKINLRIPYRNDL